MRARHPARSLDRDSVPLPAPSSADDKPLDTLGQVQWKVVRGKGQKEDVWTGTVDEEGRQQQRRQVGVTFEAEAQGVVVTKTYYLTLTLAQVGIRAKDLVSAGDRHYQLTEAA